MTDFGIDDTGAFAMSQDISRDINIRMSFFALLASCKRNDIPHVFNIISDELVSIYGEDRKKEIELTVRTYKESFASYADWFDSLKEEDKS